MQDSYGPNWVENNKLTFFVNFKYEVVKTNLFKNRIHLHLEVPGMDFFHYNFGKDLT